MDSPQHFSAETQFTVGISAHEGIQVHNWEGSAGNTCGYELQTYGWTDHKGLSENRVYSQL